MKRNCSWLLNSKKNYKQLKRKMKMKINQPMKRIVHKEVMRRIKIKKMKKKKKKKKKNINLNQIVRILDMD